MSWLMYYFGLLQGLIAKLFYFKTKTYYEDGAKSGKRLKGSAVIISNHRSFMDGIVIALKYFFKRLHFIVADFYGDGRKALKLMVRLMGGIFVDTSGRSLDFIEKSKRVTAKGGAILVFPEGGFKHGYEPARFSAGYIMLAAKTGAKIVPVASDFGYGLFKRVHLMVGNGIDLSHLSGAELTRERITELNEEIHAKFMSLFYKLKRKKAEKLRVRYEFISPKKGDVVRIFLGSHYHYGVYLSADEVIQFGRAANRAGESVAVNSVTFAEFCGAKIPEVRVLRGFSKRLARRADDTAKYARSCLGQGGYSLSDNNCHDFANRATLTI